MKKLYVVVNDAALQWTETQTRASHGCQGCGKGTKGRANIQSPVQVFSRTPFCMECALDAAMKLGTPGASVLRRLFRGAQ